MDRKTDLYQSWQIHENLLQVYRAFGLAFQALLFAAALVVLADLMKNFSAMHGVVAKHRMNFLEYPQESLSYFFFLAILIILVGVALFGLKALYRITTRREGLVRMFQYLIVFEERGELGKQLRKIGLGNTFPLFSVSRFCDLDPMKPEDRAKRSKLFGFIKEPAWKFFHALFVGEDWGDTPGGTRRYFSRTVYLHLGLLWSLVGMAAAVMILSQFILR